MHQNSNAEQDFELLEILKALKFLPDCVFNQKETIYDLTKIPNRSEDS